MLEDCLKLGIFVEKWIVLEEFRIINESSEHSNSLGELFDDVRGINFIFKLVAFCFITRVHERLHSLEHCLYIFLQVFDDRALSKYLFKEQVMGGKRLFGFGL